eukprot:1194373-Prorocentrum_minimum.AAC.4
MPLALSAKLAKTGTAYGVLWRELIGRLSTEDRQLVAGVSGADVGGVSGFGFRVSGFGFRVSGFGFGFGFGLGLGLDVSAELEAALNERFDDLVDESRPKYWPCEPLDRCTGNRAGRQLTTSTQ